jgi:hypothetical protein
LTGVSVFQEMNYMPLLFIGTSISVDMEGNVGVVISNREVSSIQVKSETFSQSEGYIPEEKG